MHLQLEPFVIKDSANVAFEKKKHNRKDNATSAGPSPERFSSNMMLHFLDFALLLERDELPDLERPFFFFFLRPDRSARVKSLSGRL